MDLALIIYLAGVIGNLSLIFRALLVLGGAVATLVTGVLIIEGDWDKFRKPCPSLLFATSIFLALGILLPSEAALNKMLVAYGAQKVATTESAQEIGPKSLKAIEKLLDDYLDESE